MNKNAIYEGSQYFEKCCTDIYNTTWQTNLKVLLVRFPVEDWHDIFSHISTLALNRILNINSYFNYSMSELETYENYYLSIRKEISELFRKISDFNHLGWQTGINLEKANLLKEQFIKDLRECKLERIVND